MGEYLDQLWNDLEQTWDLAMKVNDMTEAERSDVGAAWENVFKPAELVDVGATEAQDQNPPQKIFCRNIYGLQYNTETKYWVPFRHGDIDLAKFTED